MSYYCPQCGSTNITTNSTTYPKQESDKDTAVMTLMGAILGSIVPVLGTVVGAIAGWLTGEAMRIFGSASYMTYSCEKCGYSWQTAPHSLDHDNKNLSTNQDSNVTVEATN